MFNLESHTTPSMLSKMFNLERHTAPCLPLTLICMKYFTLPHEMGPPVTHKGNTQLIRQNVFSL